ncbi:MAG: phosphate/phosphite/phosphonate ABC transporter substrate-binding protein [Pseudomonadota bacterium]
MITKTLIGNCSGFFTLMDRDGEKPESMKSPKQVNRPMRYWRGGLRIGLLLISAIFLLVGCENGSSELPTLDLNNRVDVARARKPDTNLDQAALRFGFDPRSSLEEDVRQYLPFLAYLEQTTGYRFKLHFSGSRPVAEELAQGSVDFAAIGAASFIKAREKYTVIPLVRGLNDRGEAAYRSMIVVAPDSQISDISGLRGRHFAFGHVDSTQGHLIPRIILSEAGLTLDDLHSFSYTGSHRNCADAVVSGKTDACGMQDSLAELLVEQDLVRVLYTSGYYPSSGIAAKPNLPGEIIDKVKTALLSFDPQGRHRANLYHWERTEMPRGFASTTADDYQELRDWMIRFGILTKVDNRAESNPAEP